MPRLTESRRTARREQIASAAMRCFATKGFASTSMADIIKECGLSAGSIYSHFDSKTDLVRFVAATALEARTAGLGDQATPGEVLQTMFHSVDREGAQLLLQVWAEASRDPELAALVQDQIRTIRAAIEPKMLTWVRTRRVLDEREAAGFAGRCADAVLAAAQGCVVRVALDPTADVQDVIASVSAMVER